MLCLPAPRMRGNPNRATPPDVIYLPAELDPEPELGIIITTPFGSLRTNGIETPDIGAAFAALMARAGAVTLIAPRQMELFELGEVA